MRALASAVIAAGLVGGTAHAAPRVTLEGCAARPELGALLALELGAGGFDMQVRCASPSLTRVTLVLAGRTRRLDLRATDERARARTIALVAGELVKERPRRTAFERPSASLPPSLRSSLLPALPPWEPALAVLQLPAPTQRPSLDDPSHSGTGTDDEGPPLPDTTRVWHVTARQIDALERLLAEIADDDPERALVLHQLARLDAAHGEPLHARLVYRRLLDDARLRGYERRDDALAELASLLPLLEAVPYWLRLVEDHPASPRVADATLALARVAEVAGDRQAALVRYRRLARHEEHPSLAREGRRQSLRLYAELGDADRALPFCRTLGDEPALIVELAERYHALGRDEVARPLVHRALERSDVTGITRCRWQALAAEAADDPHALAELERLEPLARATDDAACRDRSRAVVAERALAWHRAGRLVEAARAYELHHELFPEERELRFWQAEALAALGRPCAAAPLYDEVLPRHRRQAALGLVRSTRACGGLEGARAPRLVGGAPPPLAWQRLLEAYATYRRHVSDGAELEAVRLAEASALARIGRCAEAEPLAVLVENGDSDGAREAHVLHLECAAELAEGAGRLADAAAAHLGLVALAPRDAVADEHLWRAAIELRRVADFEGAARAYERLAEITPASPRAAPALAAAADLRRAVGEPARAAADADALVRHYRRARGAHRW